MTKYELRQTKKAAKKLAKAAKAASVESNFFNAIIERVHLLSL